VTTQRQQFEAAGTEGRKSLVHEFLGTLKRNRKWWLLPIVLAVLLVTLLVVLGGSAAAPFIYPLF
jgi:hypothetical protein